MIQLCNSNDVIILIAPLFMLNFSYYHSVKELDCRLIFWFHNLIQLEKEAVIKGVPISQALDIEIPPPRPKRKPSNPYPRKTSVAVPSSQVGIKDGKLSTPFSSICEDRNLFDLEKEPIAEVWVSLHLA